MYYRTNAPSSFSKVLMLLTVWLGMHLACYSQVPPRNNGEDEEETGVLGNVDGGEIPPPPPIEDQDGPAIYEVDQIRSVDTNYVPEPTEFVLYQNEAYPLNMDTLRHLIGYPPEAKQKGIIGKVVVRVLVSPQGNCERHVVLRDPHPILTNAVVAQLPGLKFMPSKNYGKPVWSWHTIPFDFRLVR